MNIQEHISLAAHTTFRVGGPARFFATVHSAEELTEAAKFAEEKKLPLLFLGQGSNLLVSDEGFPGLTIRINVGGIRYENVAEKILVTAGAGVVWDELVRKTVEDGLSGIENLSGIPGLVGAAPIQNIGAYGSELKDTLTSLVVFDTKSLELRTFTKEECRFGYRDSIFKKKEYSRFVVVEITLMLTKNGSVNISYADLEKYFSAKMVGATETLNAPKPTITASDVREAVLSIRKQKLPDVREVGTAGSFFKNPIIAAEKFAELKKDFPDMPGYEADPTSDRVAANKNVKVSAAWIIDKVCGLKKYREGNVGTWPSQPLALVNYGGATEKEVSSFAKKIEAAVKEKTGISLEWEVRSFSN